MLPCASRLPSHVSSILTYTYPESRIPLETIASAVARIVLSSTLSRKWFQLFHPIGGVAETLCAYPEVDATTVARTTRTAERTKIIKARLSNSDDETRKSIRIQIHD